MITELNDYQTEANLTVSPEFFATGVNPLNVIELLTDAAIACGKLGKYKRALFYSKDECRLNEDGKFPLRDTRDIDVLHALLGLVSEMSELIEAYLAGKDEVSMFEEAGDQMWYLALLARGLNTDLSTVATANIEKLRSRYQGQTFQQALVLDRDMELEADKIAAVISDPVISRSPTSTPFT